MSESLIQKRAEVQGLATAIVLPTAGVFSGNTLRQTGEVGPLTGVVGIGLFQRTVLTLQRAGIRQLIVLAGPEEEQLKQALGKGPRLTIPVRWMPIREFPLDDPRTWDGLAAEVHGFCLVTGACGVFSRTLIEALRREVQEGQAIVVTRRQDERDRMLSNRNPVVASEAGRLLAFGHRRADGQAEVTADLVVLPASLMSQTGEPSDSEPGDRLPIRRWLERAAIEGRVRVLSTGHNQAHSYHEIRCAADIKVAERKLFQSLKGDFEGFVDRYFNRMISRLCTRGFLVLGLSPNSVTVLATLIGLVAAAGFGVGTYAAGIAAALLFQLSAIIDCCDGEIARLTFTESPLGAWLDIAGDNLVHMGVFAGIAYGAYVREAGSDNAWVPLALGGIAVLGNMLSFWLVNRAQRIKATNSWKTPVQAAWSDFIMRNVASRDFSVVVLMFALFDKLPWFLWMAAIGSTVFWMLLLWVTRPSAVARN